MRESFVFYRSFFEAIKNLDEKKRLKMYDLILNFALNDEEIDPKYEICNQLFTLIKPQLSANNKRYEDGKKGGRPKKTKTTVFFEKKPNVNENENENVNVNENVEKKEKKETKHFQNYNKLTTNQDPYFGEDVKKFKACYKVHFGVEPYLSSMQCHQLQELVLTSPDFFETLDDVLQKMKNIGEFKGKDGNSYKPSVSFLLKDKNYSDLRNGVYDNRAAPTDNELTIEVGKMTEQERIEWLNSL